MNETSPIAIAAETRELHTARPDLSGRRFAITGGTTGIGRAIASLLAAEGARVFICGRDEDALGVALERVREFGEGEGMILDLSHPEDIERFFREAESALGGIDGAVINTAIPAGALADTPEGDMYHAIATDFTAYLGCARAAATRMAAGSDLVFIGSMSAVGREKGHSLYNAAKRGVEGLVPALRAELAERDIKVGLVEPGLTGADFQLPQIPVEKQREMIGADRMLRAEDIAVAVHFMLTQPRRTAVSMIRVEPRLEAA